MGLSDLFAGVRAVKLLVVGVTGAIAVLTIQTAAFSQTEGSAADLNSAEAIQGSNPLLPDYQQLRQDNLDQLNRRYQNFYTEDSGLNPEGLDSLIEAINVRSDSDDPNAPSRQSVGIDLTEF